MAQEKTARRSRKERKGYVLSDRMKKTIIVAVERRFRHRKYGKVVKTMKKYYAHDDNNQAKAGDFVRIVETRPLSKLKRWRLVEILRPAETGSQEA